MCSLDPVAEQQQKSFLTLVQIYADFFVTEDDPFKMPSAQSQHLSDYFKPGYISAVTARGHQLFFLDSASGFIFYLDPFRQSVSEFARVNTGETGGLFLAADYSLYVTDPKSRTVLHFSRNGRLLDRISRSDVMPSPVDVIQPDDQPGSLFVVDSLAATLLSFSVSGSLRQVLGQSIDQPSIASSITAISHYKDYFYLVDRVNRTVMVVNRRGQFVDAFGSRILKQPVSIAADRCGRVFVADQQDNSIHVFSEKELLLTLDNSMPGLTGFVLITDIWIDESFLYIADGPGAIIKKYHIDLDC